MRMGRLILLISLAVLLSVPHVLFAAEGAAKKELLKNNDKARKVDSKTSTDAQSSSDNNSRNNLTFQTSSKNSSNGETTAPEASETTGTSARGSTGASSTVGKVPESYLSSPSRNDTKKDSGSPPVKKDDQSFSSWFWAVLSLAGGGVLGLLAMALWGSRDSRRLRHTSEAVDSPLQPAERGRASPGVPPAIQVPGSDRLTEFARRLDAFQADLSRLDRLAAEQQGTAHPTPATQRQDPDMAGTMNDINLKYKYLNANIQYAKNEIEKLKESVAKIQGSPDQTQRTPATQSPPNTTLEASILQILAKMEIESLRQHLKAMRDQGTIGVENTNLTAKDVREVSAILVQYESHPRLGGLSKRVNQPLIRHRQAIAFIEEAKQILLDQTQPQNIGLLRNLNLSLAILRHDPGANTQLRLDVRAWIKDHFLSFAEEYYLEYFQAAKAGGTNLYAQAKEVVDRLLAEIELRVVPISLTQTRYDSRVHMVRSSTRDSSLPDGVVVGILRNGLERLDGGLIQQPEVVVNTL